MIFDGSTRKRKLMPRVQFFDGLSVFRIGVFYVLRLVRNGVVERNAVVQVDVAPYQVCLLYTSDAADEL